MKGNNVTSNEMLIDRMRRILSPREGYSERRMFGTVCFMIYGNMCALAWNGSLVIRLDKNDHDTTLAEPNTSPADMNGRSMRGWVQVEPAGIASDDQLAAWLDRATIFAATLPAKTHAPKSRRDATNRDVHGSK